MEISDENIIDLYIILGVFCGTLLISTLVCIAIYCHWHKNHKYSKYSPIVSPKVTPNQGHPSAKSYWKSKLAYREEHIRLYHFVIG